VAVGDEDIAVRSRRDVVGRLKVSGPSPDWPAMPSVREGWLIEP
jgi:hypothetical protein